MSSHRLLTESGEFEGYILDIDGERLYKWQESIKFKTRQAVKVLILLITEPSKAPCQRERIISEIWRHDAEESNLDQAISAIRKALGDAGEKKKYIQTVSGVGYQFIGSVDNHLSAGKVLRIAESRLIVPRSLTLAWKIDSFLKGFGLGCSHLFHPWEESLLTAVDSGKFDLAVYNRMSTNRYINERPDSNVRILLDVGDSMGGKNFYVLGKSSTWTRLTLANFKDRIETVGVKLAIPARSDMLDNLLTVLGMTRETIAQGKIQIINIEDRQGLEILDVDPNALMISGQNVRFQARYRGGYVEVLNYDSVSDSIPKSALETLIENSRNCLIYNRNLLGHIKEADLLDVAKKARTQFHNTWNDPEEYDRLLRELVEMKIGEFQTGVSEEELKYTIKAILHETYRFGRLVEKA